MGEGETELRRQAIALGLVVLAFTLALAFLLPDGVYVGDFNGSFPKGVGFGWSAGGGGVIEPGPGRTDGGQTGGAQVLDVRAATEPATLSAEVVVRRESVLTLWYRAEAAGPSGPTPGPISPGSGSAGTSFPVTLTAGKVETVAVTALPSAGEWAQTRLAVPSGDIVISLSVQPGWRVAIDDVRLTPTGRSTALDVIRSWLWGDTSRQPGVGSGRLDLVKVISAGRLPDVAPTLLLALAIALALYLLLLRLSYRVATIAVFTLASIVVVEPSVFEVLFLAWAIHGYRTGRLHFAGLRDRPLRWTSAGVIILALSTLVAWVIAGPRVISTVNAATTGYCLALFLTIAATRSPETIADDVVTGLILGGLVGTTAAWIGGLVPELRGALWQYGVEFRGFFKDSNVFGPSLFLPVAVSLLRCLDPSAAKGRRFAWLGIFLALVSGVVMSGSRAAFGGLAVALPAVLILASPDLTRRTKISGAVLVTVVLAAGFALAAATGVEGHPLSLRSYDIQSRFPEIAAALREIPGRPLGLGPGLALGALVLAGGKSVVLAAGPCYTLVRKSESKADVWRRWGSSMKGPKGPKWDVKVTSKGQITLPKEARDLMMVREGDHLEAAIQDDAIVLRRRDEVPDGEKIRAYARRSLENMGIDPEKPHPHLAASSVRERMPALSIDLSQRIRAQREGREEP